MMRYDLQENTQIPLGIHEYFTVLKNTCQGKTENLDTLFSISSESNRVTDNWQVTELFMQKFV